jgi:YceI-like domain
LYAWRSKRRQTGKPFEDQKLQQAEMARLNWKTPPGRRRGFPKKGGGVLYETAQVKYAMIKINATTTIKRSAFGIGKYVPKVGDEVKIAIQVEATKD